MLHLMTQNSQVSKMKTPQTSLCSRICHILMHVEQDHAWFNNKSLPPWHPEIPLFDLLLLLRDLHEEVC